MKRIVVLLLALLAVLSLASCREVENNPDETTATEKETIAIDVTDSDTDVSSEPETEPETEIETDEVTTSPEETTASSGKMNESIALSIARGYFGERDADTGYLLSYQFVEITPEGDYKIKVSWYIEEDERYSTYGYLLISPNGKVTEFDM